MVKTKTTEIWDAAHYDKNHRYVTEKGAALLALLAPATHERILDLGCGTAHLTAQIADLAGAVVGVDSSPAMINAARKAYPKLTFVVANAAELDFAQEFDAVFSNAALHWMHPPAVVASRVAGALRPGGRFVAEMGGKGNTDAVTWGLYLAFEANGLAAPVEKYPWYFPSIAEYGAILEQSGLELREAKLFDRPIALEPGVGLRDWLATFGAPFFAGLSAKKCDEILSYAEFALRDSLFIQERWYVDYRRLRFSAVKTA